MKLDSNIGHGFKVHVHVHGRFDMDTILVWIYKWWGGVIGCVGDFVRPLSKQ